MFFYQHFFVTINDIVMMKLKGEDRDVLTAPLSDKEIKNVVDNL